MKPYLILQYPYEHIEIALCSQGKIDRSVKESKLAAVQLTIPHIDQLLEQANLLVKDLSFIAVNTGPGPYNTLRALITTANGIHFAQKIPLISGCGLDLLLKEQPQSPSLVIFNAFAQHVFYAFNTAQSKERGYCSIEQLIKKIMRQDEELLLLGNGAVLYQKQLLHEVKHKIIFHEQTLLFNSLEIFAKQAYEDFNAKKAAPSYLMPKYLQSPAVPQKV